MSVLAGLAALPVAAAAAPYLAGLSVRVPDRTDTQWWRGERVSRVRVGTCAATGAILAVLAGVAAGWTAAWPAYVVLALLLTPLVVIDVEHHRLPDRLVLTGVAVGLVLLAVAAAVRHDWASFVRAVVAALACGGLFFVLVLASPQSLGLGDAKLAALLGLYLGWLGWGVGLAGFFLGFVLGGVVAVVALISGHASWKSHLALGPSLAAGALLAAALHTGF